MTFEEEWAALKGSGEDKRAVHTRLNGPLPPDGAGPGSRKPRLKVSESVLRTKAEDTEKIATRFMRTDNKAMHETRQIKGGLHGFACAPAFDRFEHRWDAQMRFVRRTLATRTAKSLRTAAKHFRNTDLDIEGTFWRPPGPWKNDPKF